MRSDGVDDILHEQCRRGDRMAAKKDKKAEAREDRIIMEIVVDEI